MLTVYHGSTQTVDAPVCAFGRPRLDFGQGFYVTDIKEQAERWAKAIAGKRDTEPVLNIYHLDREQILSEGRCKIFTSYSGKPTWRKRCSRVRLYRRRYSKRPCY